MERIQSDLTVVGGGIAGICAAIAAARHGLKVVLINDRPVLGGNASSEVRVHINGSAYGGNSPSVYAREGGIIEELKLRMFHFNPLYNQKLMYPVSDAVLLDMVHAEPNIQLYLNTSVYDTGMNDGRIAWVEGLQLASERKIRFESSFFIDASGDGTVAYQAGASYRWGREARAEFDETLAPDQEDRFVMGDTVLFQVRDAGTAVPFRRPEFAYDITKLSFFESIEKGLHHRTFPGSIKDIGGLWWLEYGGHLNTVTDNEAIAMELRKLVYGIWDYIKNSGRFQGVESLILDYVSPIPGKRESRRFIGGHILTQHDLIDKTAFDDAVAVGGWSMDLHAARGIYDAGPATEWNFVPGMYNIPFRSLYSRNIPNLMLAGRNISASHVAFSSTRVMATCGCMGQAAGTAAFLCQKYGQDPAAMAQEHMNELQGLLLKDGQTIMGLKESLDPYYTDGLMITASSRRDYKNDLPGEAVSLGENGLCLVLPVETARVESIGIRIRNAADFPEMLQVHLYGGRHKDTYIPADLINRYETAIPASYDGWSTLNLQCDKPLDDKIYIVLTGSPNVSVYCNEEKPTGAVSFVYKPDAPEKLKKLKKSICFRDIVPAQRSIYSPLNVVNGYSRPYGLPHVWSSERTEGTEWIDFAFGEPKDLDEIHLVFNSDLELEHFSSPIAALVKDYDICLTYEKGTTETIEIRNNYLSLNKHRVGAKGVTRLRFVFKANYGSPYMEVFAVKLYKDEAVVLTPLIS